MDGLVFCTADEEGREIDYGQNIAAKLQKCSKNLNVFDDSRQLGKEELTRNE